MVVKPRRGSASKDVHICRTPEETQFWFERITDPMIQEYVVGAEITTDVLCDLSGEPLAQVQRQRLKIRGGEVERGVTVAHDKIARHALRIAAALKAPGVINIQCFLAEGGPLFTEINPRFGGGYPLAQAAGARFPEQIVELLQSKIQNPKSKIQTGVVMMRYDEAIYLNEKELLNDK